MNPVIKYDSKDTQANFFSALVYQRAGMGKNNIVKDPPQSPAWIYPHSIERTYANYISSIMRVFTEQVSETILPRIEIWVREKQLLDHADVRLDTWSEEVEQGIEELNIVNQEVFTEDKETLKKELLGIALLVSQFNTKQFVKTTKAVTHVTPVLPEPYLNDILKSWVNENVSLIKGLSDEYIKKISFEINKGITNGKTSNEIASKINKIGKEVEGYRSKLIARDQVGKLNGLLTQKRQLDVGSDYYIWDTAGDERVRGNPSGKYPNAKPSHWALQGMLCKWSDASVYSDDGGKTWKSRASIGAVEAHPGQAISCRCTARPYFNPVIEEANKEIEKFQ